MTKAQLKKHKKDELVSIIMDLQFKTFPCTLEQLRSSWKRLNRVKKVASSTGNTAFSDMVQTDLDEVMRLIKDIGLGMPK